MFLLFSLAIIDLWPWCYVVQKLKYLKCWFWEFPGGPVVRTLCFHCRGTGSIPDLGTKIPHAAQYGQKITIIIKCWFISESISLYLGICGYSSTAELKMENGSIL